MATSAQKEVTELIKEIRDAGYKVASSGRTHHVVLDKQGRRVVDDNGPLIISKTPSESRFREMTVHRLIKAGVFKEDPRKAGQKPKTEGRKGFDREAIERAHETQAKLSRERAEKTRALRGRLEPFIAKIGGWDKRGLQAELGHVLWLWTQKRGRTPAQGPETESGAVQNVRQLRLGNTMAEKYLLCWSDFLDEVEAQPEPVDYYFALVRELKGLPPSTKIERDRPLELVSSARAAAEEGAGPEDVPGPPVPPSVRPIAELYAAVPALTMEALFYMAQLPNAVEQKSEILNLAEKLAKLEMGGSV